MDNTFKEQFVIPEDTRTATKHVLNLLLNKILPLMLRLRQKLTLYNEEDNMKRLREVYTLCSSQINKCFIHLFDVFKLEANHHTLLQESRQFVLERLSSCINKLISIESYLEKMSTSSDLHENSDDSINVTTMYFVNWIDHTFEVLGNLANVIYKTDYKESDALFELWKSEMVECVSELHVTIDELLLSAMTLCRYCLDDDQHIVKARCQVVLRETKSLLSEIVEGDLSSVIKASSDNLKLPLIPSNVNVLIDVLKDVLYALETNTNTALLSLVVHCFSHSKSPIVVLKEHFYNESKGSCSCLTKSEGDVTEDCAFVKEFDLYNERLLQIGNFAVSCSSDQSRILTLRSGLASLEALDPHLVPALMMSPDSDHASLLIDSWCHEVNEIRDSVFLIVDPTAFAEKSKQMMHQKLVTIVNKNTYNNNDVCAVINIGSVVRDFFMVYDKCEPDALNHHEKLLLLVADLDKVQKECKIVSNFLSETDDFKYEIDMPKNNKAVCFEQLLKRLKLLYTLVNRIYTLLHPKDNVDQLFGLEVAEDEPQMACKNITHTVIKNSETYINSPKKPHSTSRSMFARTYIQSSTRNFPLSKLTKHIKTKMCTELSFSVQLDRLFDSENVNGTQGNENQEPIFKNKLLDKVKDRSMTVLYNFSPIRNRSSLRKAVLSKHCMNSKKDITVTDSNRTYDKEEFMDETTSLQITDILNQMNDMTNLLDTPKLGRNHTAHEQSKNKSDNPNNPTKNVLRINVNNQNTTITKHVWNIPVNASIVDAPMENSTTNVSQPSNFDTLERIHDLDYVESKLNSLKSQLETSL